MQRAICNELVQQALRDAQAALQFGNQSALRLAIAAAHLCVDENFLHELQENMRSEHTQRRAARVLAAGGLAARAADGAVIGHAEGRRGDGMSKKAKKWEKHVDVVETPEPQYIVTPTTWQVHRADQSPSNPEATQVRITEIDGIRTLHIDQFGETISFSEDEFEMVVQAGAQAFLQRWPK